MDRLPPSRVLLWTALTMLAAGAGPAAAQEADVIRPEQFASQHGTFGTYWYQGLAELDRYSLEQERYGEIHDGEAVLIWVTEDFHRDLQVKWDSGDRANAVPILKLNAYRRFYTGIYPYSILTSVFSPVSGTNSNPIKISTSSQEWCGHTYSQMNRRGEAYEVTLHSYFQSLADQSFSVPEAVTEDGLWTLLRRNPDALPVGPTNLIPASHYLVLMHVPHRAQPAETRLEDVPSSPYSSDPARLYTIEYPSLQRTIRIYFEPGFPHRVLAWEETQPALFSRTGGEPPVMTTRAVLTDSIMLDYWRQHDADDGRWRDILGLTM